MAKAGGLDENVRFNRAHVAATLSVRMLNLRLIRSDLPSDDADLILSVAGQGVL
jgi:hypothetical protein